MTKRLLAAVLVIAIAVALMGGCADEVPKTGDASDRFVCTYPNIRRDYCIITDTETGVRYLYVKKGYSGGLTPLLNADGTPYTGGDRP